MDFMLHIWNELVTSNTFNFIVMFFLLLWILSKINILEILSNSVQKIKKNIENSEQEKKDSNANYINIKKSVEHLDDEIAEHLKQVEIKADDIKNEVISNANKRADDIKNNIKKVVDIEEKQASYRLIAKAVSDSSIAAKEKILNMLKERPEIHQKLIDDSIKKLGHLNNENW